MIYYLRTLVFFMLLMLFGCGSSQQQSMVHTYAMDGPPLFVVGKLGDLYIEGTMDRTCMAGVGTITIHSRFIEDALECAAALDFPPNEKSRVKGILQCINHPPIFFTMSNHGPDQGFAIGKNQENDEFLIFFYHPSKEEAERRLPEVIDNINKARGLAQSSSD